MKARGPDRQEHRPGADGAIREQLGLKDRRRRLLRRRRSGEVLQVRGARAHKVGDRAEPRSTKIASRCWIVDFPFYEWNEEEKKIDFSHNPFSMPQGGLARAPRRRAGPAPRIKAFQYDIVCNGYEIASGGIRNHRPETMVKAFEIAGYREADGRSERFGGMYRAFQYGAPPHGGMAPASTASSCCCAAQTCAKSRCSR
jgi:aspartyl-tRNA synthetase